MAVPSSFAAAIGFLLAVVGMNGRGPITSAAANSLIPPDQRSTVLNIAGSLTSLIGMVCNPIISWSADRNVAITTLAIAGILVLIALMWLPIANECMKKYLIAVRISSSSTNMGNLIYKCRKDAACRFQEDRIQLSNPRST